MTTKTGSKSQATVGKHKNMMPEKIKEEKSACIKPVDVDQDSKTECDLEKIKTEPGTSRMFHCMELDPYADNAIFMGKGTNTKSEFSSETFKHNFSIKTEKKDYFVIQEGVCIINDSYEERETDDNLSIIDLTKDESISEKADKPDDLNHENDEEDTTNNIKDVSLDIRKTNEKEATKEQLPMKENTGEEPSTASKTAGVQKEDKIKSKNKTQTAATKDKNKTTYNEASDKANRNKFIPYHQTEGSLMLNRIVKVNKNGKQNYLRYCKEYEYGNEFILVYVEEEDRIRLFTKDFEPNYFYIAYYDISTSPKYNPPQWVENLMNHHTEKALMKSKQDQQYMKNFNFHSKMVLYQQYLLWKVTDNRNNRGIIQQNLYNCEHIEIYDQNHVHFSQLNDIFMRQGNSCVVDHQIYFPRMRMNFFYQIMF